MLRSDSALRFDQSFMDWPSYAGVRNEHCTMRVMCIASKMRTVWGGEEGGQEGAQESPGDACSLPHFCCAV